MQCVLASIMSAIIISSLKIPSLDKDGSWTESKVLAAEAGHPTVVLGPMCWKERTDSHKLTLDLH